MTTHRFTSKSDLHAHARAARGYLSDPLYRSEMADRAHDRAEQSRALDTDAREHHAAMRAQDRLDLLAMAELTRELPAESSIREADLGARGNNYQGRG